MRLVRIEAISPAMPVAWREKSVPIGQYPHSGGEKRFSNTIWENIFAGMDFFCIFASIGK